MSFPLAGRSRRAPRIAAALLLNAFALAAHAQVAGITRPIVFVTQVPIPADMLSVTAAFGNHDPAMAHTGRGGDLWIRYPDGTLKNLTQAAGFGQSGLQGANAIAVRDPSVSWDGKKVLFSMVVGAPTQGAAETAHWQLYEATGLGKTATPVITRVAGQPAGYDNVSPVYGTTNAILFTSDRPLEGKAWLFPQRDEYHSTPINTGLWKLDRDTRVLTHLDHSPSGDFEPIVDSFGRVIMTRWDHLQRDQQVDADVIAGGNFGTFDYSSELKTASVTTKRNDIFPEPRAQRTDLLAGTPMKGFEFNQFFPWQIREDGTQLETLNHVGRHELTRAFPKSRTDDANVVDFTGPSPGGRANVNPISAFLHIAEDPQHPGTYWGIEAPQSGFHAAGNLVSLTGSPNLDADQMTVTYLSPHFNPVFSGSPPLNHPGLFRDPLPLTAGPPVAVHTTEARQDTNTGNAANPGSLYDFRLKTLKQVNGQWVADQLLTPGLTKTVSWYDPNQLVTYTNVQLWELQPVELVARPVPVAANVPIPSPEQQIFDEENVDVAQFQAWMRANDVALAVSRNVTTRDDADRQQPFNLRVPGAGAKTVGATGTTYVVKYLQFLQADHLRGMHDPQTGDVLPGRRPVARVMHDAAAFNPPPDANVKGTALIASDGSTAAFVPAQRAMTWQLTDSTGTPVVRERFWLTFQPGEVRVCASCHGVNEKNQAGGGVPQNPPEALRTLVRYWKTLPPGQVP